MSATPTEKTPASRLIEHLRDPSRIVSGISVLPIDRGRFVISRRVPWEHPDAAQGQVQFVTDLQLVTPNELEKWWKPACESKVKAEINGEPCTLAEAVDKHWPKDIT